MTRHVADMPTFNRSLLAIVVVSMFLVGSFMRLAPLSSETRTIAAISEDGYLMLTVARNVALGRSLTIAQGTIPTNGVQPLVTFAWAGLHWLFDGDRLSSLRTVIVVQFVAALLTAVLLGLLLRDTFHHPAAKISAILAASLWFASPLALRHTTNGLETGPYACAIAAVLLLDRRLRSRTAMRAAALGAALGLLFLLRNDAVFLIVAFIAMELSGGASGLAGERDPRSLRQRLGQAALMAGSAVAVASPWLIYNALWFGHIVPISGRAQNLNIGPGANLISLPRSLAEYAWLATPLPAFLSASWPWAIITSVALMAALAATLRRGHRVGLAPARWMVLLLIHGALLAAYYGVFFGAAYFVSRYLFPISLIAVLLPCIWVLPPRHVEERIPLPGLLVALAVSVLIASAAARLYARSAVHDHGHVVDWVSTHLGPDDWVGAPQSGTLGYFHERTINLDGKVNPDALKARTENRLFRYIVDDTPIAYMADWYGLARWVDRPESVYEEADVGLLRRHFTVIVRKPEHNLVVLKRTVPASRTPPAGGPRPGSGN